MKFDSQVQLTFNIVKRAVIRDQDGPLLLTADRLCVLFRLPWVGTWHEAWIDTGACLTVLPEAVWSSHRKLIEWVDAPDGQELPNWLRSASGIGGGHFRCQLARIPVTFFDHQVRCLRPRSRYVKCVFDGGAMPKSLIGLGGRALDSRRLEVEYSAGNAWLHEMKE